MAVHTAALAWTLQDSEDFAGGRYSRGHTLSFDGGHILPASASPHHVGAGAVAEAVDPEEMLVGALSSCHMLCFLHAARLAGFTVAAYRDHAEGTMGEIVPGRRAVTHVALYPRITWSGASPDAARLGELHHAAHRACFIANSVRVDVEIK